jgi:hypothetical protein
VDCQIANVDGSGDLVKDTGLHKLDCVRYMIEAWFPDYLDKPHKYKKQIPVALSAIQSRAQGIMNRELPIKQK